MKLYTARMEDHYMAKMIPDLFPENIENDAETRTHSILQWSLAGV